MKKTLLSLALAAIASGAQAGAYIVDDFNTGDQDVSNVVVGSTVTNTNAIRTLSNTLLTSGGPINNTTVVAGGALDITNGGGEDSTVSVVWNLASGVVPTGVTGVSFLFQVVQSDGNPTDVAFKLGGSTIFATAIPGNSSNVDVTFGIDPALISAGGALELIVNGNPGWDLTLDAFGVSWTDPVKPAPEPASMALVGLGMMGLAAIRRRK